eukprot:TRINITY_DN15721_c0_g1_i1.p1 TRINITY_DN15721_c0_g1~~TRINITY_DN15721_c0_g1_i1.p1  ORF type:complete len:269 (+),score=65.07 TRINITY_DN15721_c0_g1_i1:327-1133(+)
MNDKEDLPAKTELAQHSQRIFNALVKIYSEASAKSNNCLSKSEQYLIAQVNGLELEKKLPQRNVLGILLYNIYLYVIEVKQRVLASLKGTEMPILLTKSNLDLLFDGGAKTKKKLSETVPKSEVESADSPRTAEERSAAETHVLKTIGDSTYIIKEVSTDSDKYWEFVSGVCETYKDLMNNNDVVENVCAYLIKLSKLESAGKANSYNIHRTMFCHYILEDSAVSVSFLIISRRECYTARNRPKTRSLLMLITDCKKYSRKLERICGR